MLEAWGNVRETKDGTGSPRNLVAKNRHFHYVTKAHCPLLLWWNWERLDSPLNMLGSQGICYKLLEFPSVGGEAQRKLGGCSESWAHYIWTYTKYSSILPYPMPGAFSIYGPLPYFSRPENILGICISRQVPVFILFIDMLFKSTKRQVLSHMYHNLPGTPACTFQLFCQVSKIQS